jgi:DNA-binding transcriptional ArsR family regulator
MIDPALIPVIAKRFKALGEPARLALLAELHGGERTVSELVEATKRSQPNVSQHLASLAHAGLVAARREGNRVYYRVADPYVTRICDAVCRSLAVRAREDRVWMRRLPSAGKRP